MDWLYLSIGILGIVAFALGFSKMPQILEEWKKTKNN